MILSEYRINGTATPVTICPIGDIQWNGDRHDIAYDHLQEHIAKCLTLPNPRFIGMGDYIDFVSPTNRAALAAAALYDGARKSISDKALDLTLECYGKILKPTKGKWLGLLSGHHFFPLRTGGNTDIRLAEMLDCPYFDEGIAVVHLVWSNKTEQHSINIWARHGMGYGKKAAVVSYKLEDIANYWEGIDVYLMGHFTKKSHASFDRPYPVFANGKAWLDHKTIHLVGTGGWSKGYVEAIEPKKNIITYVERAGLSPVALGAPILNVRPTRRLSTKRGERIWSPDITVEL